MGSLQAREEKAKKIGKKEPCQSCVWSNITSEQASYTAKDKDNSLSEVIRPEAGFTFRASEYSKFTARIQNVGGVGQPLIVQEFSNFPLEENLTNSRHELKGDFWAIQLGYHILLK